MNRQLVKLIQQRSHHQSNANVRRTRYNDACALQNERDQANQEVTNSLISKENPKKL